MHATLYLPQQPPQAVPVEGLSMPDPATGFARVPERVPVLLDCAPELVDVLASGPGYVAYSVFDCEGPVNEAAMAAVAKVSGVVFDLDDEDAVLCGAVLVVAGEILEAVVRSMKKSIRKPENWQDFETLCKKLWGEIWKVPAKIKKNGRTGQAQAGVDIYAIPTGEEGYWGIQCKGKDDYTNARLTTKEVDEEIGKALLFTPELKVFILATTATKDVAIEEYVRHKDIMSQATGGPEILLYCWEDIADLIEESRETFNWYVNEHQFREKFDFDVSFANGSKEVIIRPVFIKKIRVFRYKKPTPPSTKKKEISVIIDGVPIGRGGIYPDIEPDSILEQSALGSLANPNWVQRMMSGDTAMSSAWADKFQIDNVNYAFKEFAIKFVNTGAIVIEDWKLNFELQGEFRKLTDIVGTGPMGLIMPGAYTNKTTFCGDKSIHYRPHLNRPLVQGDSRQFEAYLIPRPEKYCIKIKWQLLARNYKQEGELSLMVEPEFEREYERYIDENQEGRPSEVLSIKEKGGREDSPNYAVNEE